MKNFKAQSQQGAVLVIALVMLLVLTVLAVTNMRGVTLESRITANRVETERLQNLADAALREGEFRFYGSTYLRDKLEANVGRNCIKNNKLNIYGNNRPCLLWEMDEDDLTAFFISPISFFKASNDYTSQYTNKTGAETQAAGAEAVLAWMPYRGLDAKEEYYFKASNGKNAYWNGYPIPPGLCGGSPESGDVLEGKGTYCFLVTAQANDEVTAQSTITVTYLGLN